MKREELMDAIGQLPEDMIEATARKRERKSVYWAPLAAVAACLCVMLTIPMLPAAAEKNAMAESPMEMAPGSVLMDSMVSDKDNAYGAAQAEFRATVVEVHDDYLLVEPAEDTWERTSADRIEVRIPADADSQTFQKGDQVRITYSGVLLESYPARAQNVTGIERLG